MSLNIPTTPLKRVVIVGGGFAGLELASRLLKSDYQVVIIDKNNFYQFQPLLYQVATAGLEPSSIVFPFRKVFQNHPRFHFRLAEVERVLVEDKRIRTNLGDIFFDYLVIASGATNNFFGNKEMEKNALPMKSISEALRLRNTIFQHFEDALTVDNKEEQNAFLTIAIVGGGPTGVELAGALAEMKRSILPKDYPELDFSKMRILLIQGDKKLLSAMSEVSGNKAEEYLQNMGVEVLCGRRVLNYDGTVIALDGDTKIATKLVIWAAGIIANSPAGFSEEVYSRGRRLRVNTFNQVVGHESIFAIGDVALMEGLENYPNGHPQMAQPAIQQGKQLAKNILRKDRNEAMEPFKYKELGSMATVGRNKAVVELPKTKFQGFFAWVLWLVVHLRSILGVKNKILVLFNWIWNYFTYNLSLRLIMRADTDKSTSIKNKDG